MLTDGSHSRLVQSVTRGASRNATAPEHVKRSWLRCLDEYGLDPESSREPAVVSNQELLARKEQSLELLSFADTEMANLHRQLAGSGHSIILTDRDGVLLSHYGDPSFRHAAARAGLVPGGVWSERHGGTNGMGTCLAERTPLIVHRDQHFLARNTGLTCCAAPIFDPAGELAAVLDASGESDRAQQHTLVLVNLSAQAIEKRLFLHRFRDAFVVRFHSRPELVGTSSEGMLAFDAEGRIAAVDRNALFQLGCKQAADLMSGAPLERVFNISLPALLGRCRKKSFHPLPVYEMRHGGRFFALAQEPESAQGTARTVPPAHPAAAAPAPHSSPLDELDFGDPVMARSIRAAKRVAARALPILLVGETGTGKEFFARALHAAGERASAPFVAVSCGELSEELMQGALAQAKGGTLFLDDVGELPVTLQARLLHVLEHREAAASGERRADDVRLIAASAASLEPRIRRKEFREDLFYRLQGLALTLPRLCERADKRALIRHVFAQEAADTPSVSLSESLIEALCVQRWPGNLRQLRNALRAMIALRSSERLDVADLPADYSLGARIVEPEPTAEGLNALARAERAALLRELEQERGNISHVARNLGVSRNAVYRKMHRLRIAWPAKDPQH
jgi:sigma-54 dependent transcriptional regulator, acetoin dehydrogenase operon transcriptional activator AcoR